MKGPDSTPESTRSRWGWTEDLVKKMIQSPNVFTGLGQESVSPHKHWCQTRVQPSVVHRQATKLSGQHTRLEFGPGRTRELPVRTPFSLPVGVPFVGREEGKVTPTVLTLLSLGQYVIFITTDPRH